MSDHPADPDFLDAFPAVAAAPQCDGLAEVLDAFRRALPVGDGPPTDEAARQAEQLVRDRLQTSGWRPPVHDDAPCRPGGTSAATAGTCAADRLAQELAERLADVERDSAALAERLGLARAAPDVVYAAQRCHALVTEAFLLGAVELATGLGVPDDDLPR